MTLDSGIGWDGEISFGIIEEEVVKKAGLIHDILRLVRLIESGDFSWKRKFEQHNKVTNYARQYIAQILSGTVTMPFVLPSQVELGTGIGTVSATDADLWSPTAGTLKVCTNIQQYLIYYAQFITAWQTTDPIVGTWTEVGLKDANNNLWAHAAIPSNLTVVSGEMLVCQWNVQLIGN